MISHDESTLTCMCCTGRNITGPNWKSYVPFTLPCANGYATYYLMPYQICLKYFPGPVSYSTAQANCRAQDADLIKIDSQEKYDIFKDYHVRMARNDEIEVWVQGELVGGQWQFDDGTPIPDSFSDKQEVSKYTKNSGRMYGDNVGKNKLQWRHNMKRYY
uniref:Uncharacterized protein n=1 Tax=Magallana gigas TaxID=29159 RepID=K1PDA1_MAGGI